MLPKHLKQMLTEWRAAEKQYKRAKGLHKKKIEREHDI